uniref:Transcription repressor OFP7-like n=1 Tax=Populus alba TaxID=43335 RepID=A0A4V6A9I3_POPAL|nr:transcription repressor OFP7-like [Populus alba]
MPNRLKHKLSRIITSFQLCRSKDPSCPEAPAPAIHRLSPFNPKALDINYPCNLPAPPPSTPYYKYCQVSRKTMSVGCKCQSRSCPRCCMSEYWSIESPHFACKEEARRQAKPHLNVPFSFSDESGDMSPFMVTGKNKNREINIKKNKVKTGVLSVDTSGCFSSTDVAARQSEYHEAFNKPIGNKKVSNLKNIKKLGHQVSLNRWKRSKTVTSPEIPSPMRSSVLKRVISRKVDGRVEESVAVVKKSQNPHRDFKRGQCWR